MLRLAGIACTLAVSAHGADAGMKDHCTAIVAGRKATKHGSTLVGQTVDAEGGPGDSLVFVPAQDHIPGSDRAVRDQATNEQIGSIPQVAHTYAYTWASYGVMNEHQVAFGESTTSGRLAAKSLNNNGTALFSNEELTKIALERCTTARCAVEIMGKFAEEGGFYGEDAGVETGSEALVVADPTEGWVFHIMADPTGRSAIWAAQRVPDDQVAIVPNAWVIREMDVDDTANFLLSSNAIPIARKFGWWDGKGKFNWAGTFGLGEYMNPYYGARRIWRAFDLLAPSVKLSPTQEITPVSAGYPFAVRPDTLLGVEDVFRVYRDYLEGTEFSLVSDKLAAGPFGSPRRVMMGDAEKKHAMGAWERPISIFRNNYAVISECRTDAHGIVWMAPHSPHASVFSPAWSSAATGVPRAFTVDKTKGVDRESLFWASSAVANWADGSNFALAIQDIRAAQVKVETDAFALASKLAVAPAGSHDALISPFAAQVHTAWWDLFWQLMGKYSDGYVVTVDSTGAATPAAVGYPEWYLEAVDFEHGVRGATAAQYAALKQRMDDAATEFKKIDDARARPGAATMIMAPEFV